MIKTILFDLDGVLVDACEWHYLSLNEALKKISGIEISRQEHETVFNGLTTKNKLKLLAEVGKISFIDIDKIWELKQENTRSIILQYAKHDESKINLHKYLVNCGINIGCVTNSIKDTAKLMLTSTGQMPYINILIANDMISQPKPNGQGYLLGMSHFNSNPQETLIVEDSFIGIQAAKSTHAHIWEVSGCLEVILENIISQLKKYD